MKFEFEKNNRISTLAWCARIERGTGVTRVEHGADVEIFDEFFVEGAWNGDFGTGGMDASEVLLGSGGCLRSGEVLFCPTSHSMDRLYSVRADDALYVSNSMVYVLEASGTCFDRSEWRYEVWFMSYLNGLDRARKHFDLDSKVLTFHYCSPFAVNDALEMRLDTRPALPRFGSYEDYVDTLRCWVRLLSDNAADSRRSTVYAPLTTISSGYDSTVCAVLAADVGCTEAVNISDSRPVSGRRQDDSGDQIAKILGLQVKRFQRTALRDLKGFPEAEFLAGGAGGDDLVFTLFGEHLSNRLLFTGFLGDTLWGTTGPDPERSVHHQYVYPPGATLNEFRLRVGFIHLPIPLLTFTRHPDLRAIACSDEMARWRLGGDYDRPLARRLIESRGVERGTFATEKSAVTVPLWSVTDAAQFMSSESAADLEGYAQTQVARTPPNLGSRLRYWRDAALARLEPYCSDAAYWRLTKLVRMLTGEFKERNMVWCRTSTLSNSLKFHWAIDKLRDRYSVSTFAVKRVTAH